MGTHNLEAGLTCIREKIVQYEDTARSYGSGLIPVYATPAMVGFMEATAQEVVRPFLPDGYITLGIEINVKHSRATGVGKKIICEATLEAVEERLFTFLIIVRDEKGEIGQAVHKRYMVNTARFMDKLEQDRQQHEKL